MKENLIRNKKKIIINDHWLKNISSHTENTHFGTMGPLDSIKSMVDFYQKSFLINNHSMNIKNQVPFNLTNGFREEDKRQSPSDDNT